MSHPGNDYLIDIARDEVEEDTIDITPDMDGLLHFIRRLAMEEVTRHTAKLLIIWGTEKGWRLTSKQMDRILDGENLSDKEWGL